MPPCSKKNNFFFCYHFLRLILSFHAIYLGANFVAAAVKVSAPSVQFSSWLDVPHGKVRYFQLSQPQQQIRSGLEIALEKDWHTYWLNPGDSGAPPRFFGLNKSNKKENLPVLYPFPERILAGPLVTYGYSQRVIYFLKSSMANYQKVQAEILVCKEECLPGTVNLKVKDFLKRPLEKNRKFNIFLMQQLQKLPQALNAQASYSTTTDGENWQILLDKTTEEPSDLFWFPEQVGELKRPNWIKTNKKNYNFYAHILPGVSKAPNKKALLVVHHFGEKKSTLITFVKKNLSGWPYFLMALVGGFLLNFMPCVFPIVSLKAVSIAKSSGEKLTTIRKNNYFYCLGVVTCFLILAFIIYLLRTSGNYIGWGFQLQNPWFVFGLTFLFLIMGLNFLDVWSWSWVPQWASPRVGRQEGAFGSFWTGVLAVIVASPCTGPFMGAAIGFAVSQSPLVILYVFLGLGLGMSAPFLILALLPSLSKKLPRPGAWMITFKKAMGVLLILTSIWLGWVGAQTLKTRPLISEKKMDDLWTSLSVKEWERHINVGPQPQLVNFTADWCVTCKVNERLVFSDPKVIDFFKTKKIQLYKVDWTKKESLIGKKLAEYGRAGVPLYLYYKPSSLTPKILPELLTSDLLIDSIKE